jgi:uncharacterized protein involved in exopolysaccharide biosynthesis
MLNPTTTIVAQVVSKLLFKWKRIAYPTIILTAIACLIVMIMKEEFDASTVVVLTNSSKSDILGKLVGSSSSELTSLIGLGGNSDQTVITALLESRALGLATVKKFRLDTVWKLDQTKLRNEDIIRVWASMLTSDLTNEGELVISFRDQDPARAAAVVRYCVSWLDSSQIAIKRSQANANFQFIEGRAEETKKLLDQAEDSILYFQKENGSFLPEEDLELTAQKSMSYDTQIDKLDLQIIQAEQATGRNSSQVLALKDFRNSLQSKYISLRSNRQIASTRNMTFVERMKILVSYERLKRNVERQASVYKYLVQQVEGLRIEAAQNTPTLTVVDPVILPQKKSTPKRMLIVETVFVLSVLFSSSLVIFDNEIKSFKQTIRTNLMQLKAQRKV